MVPEHGYPIEWINIQGLRGNGVLRWLVAPLKLLHAMYQAFKALRRRRPVLVLGMGGFVTGPGGVVARLMGIPLVIHEQNAFPGLTNRLLAPIARRVLEAFPESFRGRQAEVTGNPVRADIAAIEEPATRLEGRGAPLRLLVLGGSQGAQALNETVPAAIALIEEALRPQVRHQAGRDKDEVTRDSYNKLGVKAKVSPFVSDMKEAYSWADLVVCRAGALTVAELAAAGAAAVLVPYPHAVDDHQTRNGSYLADEGAALLLPQKRMTPERLAETLTRLCENRGEVMKMAVAARSLALPKATQRVADICLEVAR